MNKKILDPATLSASRLCYFHNSAYLRLALQYLTSTQQFSITSTVMGPGSSSNQLSSPKSAGTQVSHPVLVEEVTKSVMLLMSSYGGSSMINLHTPTTTTGSPQTSEGSASSRSFSVVRTNCDLV